MDWGVVASVLIANVILILAVAIVGSVLFGLATRGMKKEIEAGGAPKCPTPGCPPVGEASVDEAGRWSTFVR